MKLLTLYCIGIICIIVVFGGAYQFISVKIDNARYPPLGKLVDIGGYKLHIYETGHGSGPTIVLDMGMGGNILYWSLVQKEISKFASCSGVAMKPASSSEFPLNKYRLPWNRIFFI